MNKASRADKRIKDGWKDLPNIGRFPVDDGSFQVYKKEQFVQMNLETKQQLFIVGSYLMVFLFGWMCAVFNISDSTNPKVETPVIGGTAKDWRNSE